MAACCCPCIPHYTEVGPPAIGTEIFQAHNAEDHQMTGDCMPLIEMKVQPQQTMIAEEGAFAYYQDGMKMENFFNDGSLINGPGCCGTCKQCCMRCCAAGESAAITHFTNETSEPKTVAFGSDFPGQITAVDLTKVPDNVLFAMNGSFFMGPKGTRIDAVRADCVQCCCGAGLCFQKIDGNGIVFLTGGGTVVKQELKNEKHRIDPGALVAFTKGLSINVQMSGGFCTACCGGEGVSLTTLEGTGTYWISSSSWGSQIEYALQFLPNKKS